MADTEHKDEFPDGSKVANDPGEKVIPADELEKIDTKTSRRQLIVIIASVILLLVIAFTFEGAEKRENHAAQATFSQPVQAIINSTAESTGLRRSFGYPTYTLEAETKSARIFVLFEHGPIPPHQAAIFAQDVCAQLARAYVLKGYAPRRLDVSVSANVSPYNGKIFYGTAIYNGNIDALYWQSAHAKGN